MQTFKGANSRRHEPFTNFRYSVRLYTSGDSYIRMGFSNVSGLKTDIAYESRKELGNVGVYRNIPGAALIEPIRLSHGMSDDDTLVEQYARQFTNFGIRPVPFKKVIIELWDKAGNPRKTWTYLNAWVTEVQWGDLNAMASEVMLETITILPESLAFASGVVPSTPRARKFSDYI